MTASNPLANPSPCAGALQRPHALRRGAGVVERGGLENRCARKRTEGSNPSLSASRLSKQNPPELTLDNRLCLAVSYLGRAVHNIGL